MLGKTWCDSCTWRAPHVLGESDEPTVHHDITCGTLALHEGHGVAGVKARDGRLTEMRSEKAGDTGRTEERGVRAAERGSRSRGKGHKVSMEEGSGWVPWAGT